MLKQQVLFCSTLLLLSAAACSSSHDAVEEGLIDDARALTYYADVKPIIDANCTVCHVNGGIGPLPLTSYAEVSRVRELVAYDVGQGVMPPWSATPAPYGFFKAERRLTPLERETIVQWAKQGGVEGDPSEEPPKEPAPKRGLSRVDGAMEMPEAYTPHGNPDEYRCFPMKWPYEETKFLTGLNVEPGERSVVHHGVVYLVSPENAKRPFEKDDAAEGLGYPCNGVSESGAWLTSYEPGGFGEDVPGGLGFEVKPGSVFVLQMHYNSSKGSLPDRSRIDFAVADQVERIGRVVLLQNPLWLAGFMNIPAGESDVVHSVVTRPAFMARDRSYLLHSVDLHMHQLGRSGSIGIVRTVNGERRAETLLSIPRWQFEWQETYVLEEPVRIEPGDQLYVECHFDNSEGNQPRVDGQLRPPRDVNWGDNTADEMCLGAVLIGPAE